MNIKLQNKLFKKYPKLFRQKDLSIMETCMCWGIDCEDGWYWLIDNLCSFISKLSEDVEAVQVKEKFGTLRFYINGGSEMVNMAIEFAEFLSGRICEKCGSLKGKVRGKGWLYTMCNECWKKWEG